MPAGPRAARGNASETVASEVEPGAGGQAGPPGLAGGVGPRPRPGPPGACAGSPGRLGLGLNRGQEVSPVWALGPWHSPSSFLIPGPVGVVGPWRYTVTLPPPGICLLSRGEPGPPAKLPRPGRGPWASAPTDPSPATSCSRMGKLRPCIREGHPRGCPSLGIRRSSAPSVPPPHTLEEHDTFGKPTWRHLRWDLGLGPGSVGAQAGTVQTGAV